ncbi:hypothetical protein H0H93_016152 [Arthromyces matolae]|nr:hypothetical protein H0H93_016152 [Arthromyces matolae]
MSNAPEITGTLQNNPKSNNEMSAYNKQGANPSLVDYNSDASHTNVGQPITTNNPPAPKTASPGNRFNNAELPALPRPKSRKSNRKERKDAKKSPQGPLSDQPPLPPMAAESNLQNATDTNTVHHPSTNEEDDQLTPKASNIHPAARSTPAMEDRNASAPPLSPDAPLTVPTSSPPRIPADAKGKGKELPIPYELPRTLLLAQTGNVRQPPQKRKFEDTPSKSKPPNKTINFQTPKHRSSNETQTTHISKTVDPFDHPATREPVYSDDPEPGVLPEPAYYMQTPPFLRYPQDVHLKSLADLMTAKGSEVTENFEVRKEGVRLQDLARKAGAHIQYSDSGDSDNMQVDRYTDHKANHSSQIPEVNLDVTPPPSPSPLPRGRQPVLPSPDRTRAHSSQGIPVRYLFTREYETHYPTQYTRSLGTRSPEGSHDIHQNASEASYNEDSAQSIQSGEYPGIFQDDIAMSDIGSNDYPAPPYQGDSTADQTPQTVRNNQPEPAQTAQIVEATGPHDPLRVWTPSDIPGIQTNSRNLQIVSTPPNGWPEIYITYHPMLDLNDESLATVEMARAPGTCWGLPIKSSNEKHKQLGFVDKIKRTIADMVTILPGQSIGVTRMEAEGITHKRKTRFSYPHFLLINGLNRDQKEYLVNQHAIIVDEETSFLIYPMEVSQKLFVGTIAGLHYEERDSEIVLNLVKQTLRSHNELNSIMAADSPNHTRTAFRNLINNIHITFVSIGKPDDINYIRGWNVILPPHSMSMNTTKKFADAIRQITFTILGFGRGTFMLPDDSPHCEGCKSLGHSWQDCAYPKITGWRGPKPSTKKEDADDTRNQYDWFNTTNNQAGPSSRRPPGGQNQRGRAASRGGNNYRGRGSQRGGGRGARRF